MRDRQPGRLIDLRDGIALAGLLLMAAGLALVSIPAALIVPGVLLFIQASAPAVIILLRRPPS